MSSSKKKQHRKGSGPPPNPAGPKVRVKIALANTDLEASAALVKSAILYADEVTVYSPAASMFNALTHLASVTEPRDQVALIAELCEAVPSLRGSLDMSDDITGEIATFLSFDRQTMRTFARASGSTGEVDDMYRRLDELGDTWTSSMNEMVLDARVKLGADELLTAVEAKAVKIADLFDASNSSMVADSIRLASGTPPDDGSIDNLMANFTARLVEMAIEPKTFPLYDAQSQGFMRAFEKIGQQDTRPAYRAAEIATATTLMGYLPNFVSMPMDEILDLRRELKTPLKRFRAAVGRLSREFESRPFDEAFSREVEDAWRLQVEPALADIREALAEHGLLKEIASIALGDPRRLMFEAGAVVAAAQTEVLSLTGFLTVGATAGVPTVDVLARALNQHTSGRNVVKKNAFYFLHQVGEATGT